MSLHQDLKNCKQLIQTIILKKSDKYTKAENSDKKLVKENTAIDLDMSFKVNKFGYFNVKKRTKIYFGQGKINLKTDKDKENTINLIFYDSSLNLRFQGIIDTKKFSFNVDINSQNCVKVNEIIGLIFYLDENGQNKYDIMMTNIYIYFQNENDMNLLLNSFC